MPRGSNASRSLRLVDVALVGPDGLPVALEADEAERDRLAARYGLGRIDRLSAGFRLRREGRDGLHVTGTVDARVVQTCVVTLEPFEASLSQPVDVHFRPARDLEASKASGPAVRLDEPGHAEEDPPDPIVDGRIDLWALMAEFLALGLDPYPRKPDAVFVEPAAPDEAAGSPFAALSRLRDDRAH